MRYKVHGHTTVNVVTVVEAVSPEEALTEAYDELNSLISYVGNGGDDKLVGIDGYGASVSADDEITWTSAEELGPMKMMGGGG